MKPVLRPQARGAVSVVGAARQGAPQSNGAVARRPLGNPRGTATSATRYAGATGPATLRQGARVGSVNAPHTVARTVVNGREGEGRSVSSTNSGKGSRPVVVLRREIGDVLRDARQRQGRTLRQISAAARVSLGYLSEVERGQKEASSELLASICAALEVPMSLVLREVSDRVAAAEGYVIPDTVPAELAASMVSPLVGAR